MALQKVECLVAGAGVIGLAVARALARSGREVLVCEREQAVGQGTSSRNSEVIHAGIYYLPGSLKAQLCVQGNRSLYAFCQEYGVDHCRRGKLVVATSDAEVPKLRALQATAVENGVPDLKWLSPQDVKALEPEVECVQALWSGSTGVVDSHGLMLALLGDAEAHGAMLSLNTPVTQVKVEDDGNIVVSTPDLELNCKLLVNCTGLYAPQLAAGISGPAPPGGWPRGYFAKGNYFALQGKPPFTHLVYPIPEQAGLGVHATVDLGGRVRFGPDVQWVDGPDDYQVDPARGDRFYEQIRRYWPGLQDGSLVPDYAGIRPKLQRPGEPPADFLIQGWQIHGVQGLINLLGIESPGLTASLAIANMVAQMLHET